MKSRRLFLSQSSLALAALTGIASKAQSAGLTCELTPRQPKGPFYPVVNQADKDTDLTSVLGRTGRAQGQVVWVGGVVRNSDCEVVEGALVEIWQACATGRYNHPNDPNTTAALDPDFQYWGRAVTDAAGVYRFKTILPGSYPADRDWVRPPHIHFRVLKRGYHELITQMYFAGQSLNDADRILQSLSADDQKRSIVDFRPNHTGELEGTFDIQIKAVGTP